MFSLNKTFFKTCGRGLLHNVGGDLSNIKALGIWLQIRRVFMFSQ